MIRNNSSANGDQRRCRVSTPNCGSCESCTVRDKIQNTRQWFHRCGGSTQKLFVLGLLRRTESVWLLDWLLVMLRPLQSKDVVYSRSRLYPGLQTDQTENSQDHALDKQQLTQLMENAWSWYKTSTNATKGAYLSALLTTCTTTLLTAVYAQAHCLRAQFGEAKGQDDLEVTSLADTEFSFCTNSDLDLLSSVHGWSSPLPAPSTAESVFPSTSEPDPRWIALGINRAHGGVSKFKDIVGDLPVFLGKKILGMLDERSLTAAKTVSKKWKMLALEVLNEFHSHQEQSEGALLAKGGSVQCNPCYAKDIDVPVPNLYPGTQNIIHTNDQNHRHQFKTEISLMTAYEGCSTRKIIMEERNVFCGAYNIMVVCDSPDTSRVITTQGRKLIGVGSMDRKVRLIEADTATQRPHAICGHSGSVRCVDIDEERNIIISGSFDTSIRLWALNTGRCQRIFRGHTDTVLTLKLFNDLLISGSKDMTCRVWKLTEKKPILTLTHKFPVTSVAMNNDLIISGSADGKVKVWAPNGFHIKTLKGHQKQVTTIRFDKWHIVTAAFDGYVMGWSSVGAHAEPICALRHPAEVLCAEFMFLRVLSGCADGKIRLWNFLTGECLRILRGNSHSDPVTQLIATENKLTVNTLHNVLVLSFEPMRYDYTLPSDTRPSFLAFSRYRDAPGVTHPHAYIRAQRLRSAGTDRRVLGYKAPMHTRRRQVHSAPLQVIEQKAGGRESERREVTESPCTPVTVSSPSPANGRRTSWACEGAVPLGEVAPLPHVKVMLRSQLRGQAQALTVSQASSPPARPASLPADLSRVKQRSVVHEPLERHSSSATPMSTRVVTYRPRRPPATAIVSTAPDPPSLVKMRMKVATVKAVPQRPVKCLPDGAEGQVSLFNLPFRDHVTFRLRTNQITV